MPNVAEIVNGHFNTFDKLDPVTQAFAEPGAARPIAFTLTYQEYIYALTFVSASANKTISYGVTTDLVRGDVFYWGSLMSGALIGALPVAIVYAFSLDHFIHGLTAGALK